jgi:hypothetical protein
MPVQERTNARGRRLVDAARLLRDPQRYVARFGQSSLLRNDRHCFQQTRVSERVMVIARASCRVMSIYGNGVRTTAAPECVRT